MNTYWSQQEKKLRSLMSQTVLKLSGLEMALREVGPTGLPVFQEPGVYCRQLDHLRLELTTGDVIKLGTCRGHSSYGICLSSAEDASNYQGSPGSIFRLFEDLDVRGKIEALDLKTDEEGCVIKLVLTFSHRELHIVAGEALERFDDQLVFRSPEESLLLFQSAADIQRTPWVME